MNSDKHLKSSKEVISDIYNSSYKVLNAINNTFFNRIDLDDTFTTKSVMQNGKSIISKANSIFIYVQLDNIVRYDKRSIIKEKALYDTTLRMLYEYDIACIMCFLNGRKIHMDSRILLFDSYVYIEVPDIDDSLNLSLVSIHNDMAYSNNKIIGNHKYIGFKDGLFNMNNPDEVYYSKNIIFPSILNMNNDNIIEYSRLNFPIDSGNIFTFDNNNALQMNVDKKFMCDGFIKCDQRIDKSKVFFICNNIAEKSYVTKIDYYKSLADYRLDEAQGNIPDLVSQFEHLVLRSEDQFLEVKYEDTFSNIFEHDPEYYIEYLNKVMKNDIIRFKYRDLIESQKNIFSNESFASIEPDIQEFYTERFMLSFSNREEYDYTIFIDGRLVHIYDIVRHNMAGVEYVFINKQSIIDTLNDDTVFEIVRFEKEYLRRDLVIMVDNDPYIYMDTLLYPTIKNIRFYIDGLYISREHLRFYEKSDNVKGYYIFCELPIRKGSTVTIENYFISDEYVVNIDNITTSIVQIPERVLLYPLSPNFYDVYVNGIKQYDVHNISANIIKINNMKSNNKLIIIKKRFIDDLLYLPEYGRAINKWDRYVKAIGVDSFVDGNDIVNVDTPYDKTKHDSYQFKHYQLFRMFIDDNYIDCLPHDNPDIWNNFQSLIIEHPNLQYPIVLIDASEKMIISQPVNSSLEYYRKQVEGDDYINHMTKTGILDASKFTGDLDRFLPVYGIPIVYRDDDGNEHVMYDANAVQVNADSETSKLYKVPHRFVEDYYNKPIEYNITGITMNNSNVIPINDVYSELSSVRMYHTEDIDWVIKKI